MLAKKPKGATEKRKTSSVSGLLWMFVGAVLTLMIGVFLYLSPLFNFSPAGSGESTDADRQVQQRVNTDTDNGDYEFYDILPNQEMATIPDEDFGEGSSSSQSGQITDFEPDVVVNQPENTAPSNNDAGNFGISESTTIEPSRSNNANNAANSSNDDDIVIVEEDATYDGTPAANNTGAAANRANTANASNASIQPAKPAATYILQINSFGDADEADRRRAQVLMAGVDARVVKNTTSNGLPIYQVISRPMNNRQAVATAQQRLQNNGIDSIIVEQRR
ncbi:SPOR domain-containing protein [Psychrobacter sp. M9-54-1]|uniref:SPOR domain-containing protein n=1 Tax=Psychrobacter communis TaxID=2762238 RepID=A0ABR8RJZ8_9GAMM|nr:MULTISPECIES: SPOR domain-containing protein [Psychrobacter]MBD7948129.1 SPOR domain-containing protein [Psychrobacter communis]MBK3394615.1 SPOR domain-containing protein [Psychrobacter sp. M9-54-1]MBO6199361.1 SPOR domain-containing protein [Psychrobacter sp.]